MYQFCTKHYKYESCPPWKCKCQNQSLKRHMMIWILDSLLLHRKGHAGLIPPSHWIPVLPSINPGGFHHPNVKVSRPTQDPPPKPKNKNSKKTKKKNLKKNGERELPLRILPRRMRLLTSLLRKKARTVAWPTATKHTGMFKFSKI